MNPTGNLFEKGPLQAAIAALKDDLLQDDGPRISTMRNYRFAIVPYDPKKEFELRRAVQRLATELTRHSWVVYSISLQQLLLDRVRKQGPRWAERVVRAEKAAAEDGAEFGLNYLKEKLAPLVEGPEGLAADCARLIRQYAADHPEQQDRILALIGRAGTLYPFFRSSALLRHLDGHTDNVPVVLLYPGDRRGPNGLSFMGQLDPDHDYRPRIYP